MKNQDNSLVMREVTEETFDEFLGLIGKLAEYEKLSPPDEDGKKRLRTDCLADKPKYEAFLGEIGGEYVGYVIYFFTYSSFLALPTLYIEDIFVLEPYRKSGVGQKMFDRCRAIAKQAGCGRIEFTVLTWNKSAQAFYEKNRAKRMETGSFIGWSDRTSSHQSFKIFNCARIRAVKETPPETHHWKSEEQLKKEFSQETLTQLSQGTFTNRLLSF